MTPWQRWVFRPAAARFEGAVRRVRTFGPIQRAEVALSAGYGDTNEIDAPRDREIQVGDIIGLHPGATGFSLRRLNEHD